MTDWYRKPYADLNEVEAEKAVMNDYEMPVQYWDNDDGFWDTYISHRMN